MASNFKDDMDGNDWEDFCRELLRHHFGWACFFPVPARDGGDHGIEFYTSCGTIFQCYRPDPSFDMKDYKRYVQRKINDDLKKLMDNESEIVSMLGDIKIKRWALMIPEIKTKDFLKYCARKTKEIKLNPPSFIDDNDFIVRVDTDESFEHASLIARTLINKKADIKVSEPDSLQVKKWRSDNVEFYENIKRKTDKITPGNNNALRETLISKYVQLNDILEVYRDEYPEIYGALSDLAWYNLDVLRNDNLFSKKSASEIFRSLIESNRDKFSVLAISNSNNELFSMGYIAQWVAECNMDFVS